MDEDIDDSAFPNYPAFEPMFLTHGALKVPPYLVLLNLGPESDIPLDMLRSILSTEVDLNAQIAALFDEFNWRPQLVGAVALGLRSITKDNCSALWRAFDSDSWVSPQLAAIASLVDEDFEQNARQRIDALCPINTERLKGLDWSARHSAAGPGSIVAHSSKGLAALCALGEQTPTASGWLTPLLARDDIKESIAADYDGGGQIATEWLSGFVRLRDHEYVG